MGQVGRGLCGTPAHANGTAIPNRSAMHSPPSDEWSGTAAHTATPHRTSHTASYRSISRCTALLTACGRAGGVGEGHTTSGTQLYSEIAVGSTIAPSGSAVAPSGSAVAPSGSAIARGCRLFAVAEPTGRVRSTRESQDDYGHKPARCARPGPPPSRPVRSPPCPRRWPSSICAHTKAPVDDRADLRQT